MLGKREKLSIFQRSPARVSDGHDIVSRDVTHEASVDALVEERPHDAFLICVPDLWRHQLGAATSSAQKVVPLDAPRERRDRRNRGDRRNRRY